MRPIAIGSSALTEPDMHRTSLSLFVTSMLVFAACDRESEAAPVASASAAPAKPAKSEPAKAEPAKAEPAKAEPAKAEPPANADKTPVLEETDLPGLGKLKMPKGFTSTAEKHWSFDLGNYEAINVSWEPHGAPNLKKAESLSKILANAETVKSSKTLPSGFHEIERVRASDGFTFIAVFGPDWYVKCVAPAAHMETCREIVRSKA
jgi:hypothetical protein